MRAMKDSGIEWIGEVPQNWLTKKLKYCVDLRLQKTADKAASTSYIGLEHVTSFIGTLCKDYEAITDFNGDTLDFCEGDVLFGKLRPYLAKAYQAKDNGRCSSEFWVMNPTGIEGRYLLYYVLSHGFISDIDHSTFGVKMPRAEWSFAGNEKIPFPSLAEQHRISEYLDTKCAEIDALIAAKEKTNALLRERRQSIIYEAVTKGLDPNAPMKDSGVEWIGEISEGWKTVRIKHVIDRSEYGIKIGPFGSTLANRTLISGPYNVYSQANLISNSFSDTNHHIDGNTFDDLRGYEVKPGDVCVSMMGTIGKCRVVPAGITKGIMDSHLIKIRLDEEQIDPRFFEYVYDKDNSGGLLHTNAV